ncbi:MAG: hypothetical protein NT066_07150 [Candidatus Omnitrophica bacterium]|nr:hypothetical protein [Candidatus Omnitrophota bacterium]
MNEKEKKTLKIFIYLGLLLGVGSCYVFFILSWKTTLITALPILLIYTFSTVGFAWFFIRFKVRPLVSLPVGAFLGGLAGGISESLANGIFSATGFLLGETQFGPTWTLWQIVGYGIGPDFYIGALPGVFLGAIAGLVLSLNLGYDRKAQPAPLISESEKKESEALSTVFLSYWWLILKGFFIIITIFLIASWIDSASVFVEPSAESTKNLSLFTSAFMVLNGVFWTIFAIYNRRKANEWRLLFFEGLFGIGIGILIVILAYLTLGIVKLSIFVVLWMLVSYIFQFIAGIRLRNEVSINWWLVFSILSIFFAILLFMDLMDAVKRGEFLDPETPLIFIYLVPIAITFGICIIIIGFKLRRRGIVTK